MQTKCSPRELALDLCRRSRCKVKVAAVLSDRRGIFEWGWNHAVEVGRAGERFAGAGKHAEEHAFERAHRMRLRGATLTVAAMRTMGEPICARPCPERCMVLAKKHGIEHIEYTVHGGEWEAVTLEYVRAR